MDNFDFIEYQPLSCKLATYAKQKIRFTFPGGQVPPPCPCLRAPMTTTKGAVIDRFAVAGPRVWNCLPAALRAVEDYEQFKKLLKHICSIRLRCTVTFLLLGAVYKLTLLLLLLVFFILGTLFPREPKN